MAETEEIMVYLALIMAGMVFLVVFFVVDYDGAPPQPTPWSGMIGVNCQGSSSMGNAIGCTDTLELRSVGRYAALEEGRIYVYEYENQTIVHRLIYCPDDCNKVAVFRGDANPYSEEVPRKAVKYIVTGIRYE